MSLDGDHFTATAYIDTSLGTLGVGEGQSVSGGLIYNTTNPVFETLTINDNTYDFGPNLYGGTGDALIADYNQYAQGGVEAFYSDSVSFIHILVAGATLSVPSAFGEAFSVSSNNTPFLSQGAFQIFTPEYFNEATGELDITAISSPGIVNFTSSAPEPSTWALMIAGVGMIGAALRLGRRRGALATA